MGGGVCGDLVLIEVIGIPYAGKTTLCQDLYSSIARYLKRQGRKEHNFSIEYIEEYRGTRDEYNKIKSGIELNLRRVEYIEERLTKIIGNKDAGVVILDRGFWDTVAWIEFFVEGAEEKFALKEDIKKKIDYICSLVGKYYVFWVATDPLIAVTRSNKYGKIVNLTNVKHLHEIYENMYFNSKHEFKFKKINSEHVRMIDVVRCALKGGLESP